MKKLQETASVLEHEPVARQTFRLRLHSPGIARSATAGQFAMIQVREGVDPLLRRPLSFHRLFPGEGCIEFLYRVVGRGTWWLSRVRPGETVDLLGPLGNGFDVQDSAAYPVALIAGGIGIAPLFQLVSRLLVTPLERERPEIHLFYGARTASELLPDHFLQSLGISSHVSTDDGTGGFHGRVTDMFQRAVGKETGEPRRVFACGPLAMQFHVARWVLARGIESQLSLEALMACGVGACLGCALPAVSHHGRSAERYVHVCKDGPIFRAEAIQWTKVQAHPAPPPSFLYS
ncbi:MAG: dihydroorotate dehydrogenase electron transfer subunit [Deltaproteobacteria bacterium]|nr:dihydroorotate dehydrogenase electron transfer subunit [Deltaproteobacteria bacterium]